MIVLQEFHVSQLNDDDFQAVLHRDEFDELWKQSVASSASGMAVHLSPVSTLLSSSVVRFCFPPFSDTLTGLCLMLMHKTEKSALYGLLKYINKTQKGKMPSLHPQRALVDVTVAIDASTRKSLELTTTLAGTHTVFSFLALII